MRRRRGIVLVAVTLLALVVVFFATRGTPKPALTVPGSFSFAALGDAPYYVWEEIKYRLVLRELDAHDLGFVLHVGDIFWRPCTEPRYRRSLDRFNALRHPVLYTPGDNEWTDCYERGSGGFSPRERLDLIRRLFFHDPDTSLGGRRLPLVSQSGAQAFPEFVENARWSYQGILFATVHLVGTTNGLKAFPGRTAADDEAVKRRTEAAAAWVRDAFAEARAVNASAVVIGFHANPSFEDPAGDTQRGAYEPFITALEEEVEMFAKPVLAVHGDGHTYTVDHPLVRRTSGRLLTSFTRLQVPGSPEVGWVRVVVTPASAAPFSFEEHVVPTWKYW